MFSEPDSFLLFLSIEIIIDEALERYANMQMTKKGEQLLESIKDSAVLQLLSKGLHVMGPNMRKHGV